MKTKARVCCACKKTYEYCPRCAADKSKPRFMFAFCSQNCKNLDTIASDFLAGDISKEDAKAKFDTCDLSNTSTLHPAIVKAIDEAYADDISINFDFDKKSKK